MAVLKKEILMPLKLEKYQGTRVILVRHGESTYNELGLYQGSSNESVLTETGCRMARQTGAFLSGLSFDAVYVSSLQRAQQTASEMLATMTPLVDSKTIHVTKALSETDLPAWHGLPFQYVKEHFAADYQCWKQRPHEFRMELPFSNVWGKHTQQYCYPALDLYNRIQQFWQKVLPCHQGQTILIIAHGGTNRALISTAMGVTPDRYHTIEQSNCGISILNFPIDTEQPAQLQVLNLTTHVGETLPKIKNDGIRLLLIPSGKVNQELAQLLKQTTINFSINSTSDNSRITAQQILKYHPETVQLEVLREDFPEVWLQSIQAKNYLINSSQIITGLVIASDAILKHIIVQTLGMNYEKISQLQLHENTISSIYYPDTQHPPVLQAVNISASEQEIIFDSSLTQKQRIYSRNLIQTS
jgi:broad specificity phosphatase PhoE